MERTKLKEARIAKGVRERRKLTQKQVALELGCSVEVYSLWERGESDPQAHYRDKLLEYYGATDPRDLDLVPRAQIMTLEDIIEMLKKYDRREIVAALQQLPVFATVDLSVLFDGSLVSSEEFLGECHAAINSCWYLIKHNGLAIADHILKESMPTLSKMALTSSKYQNTAAALAVQAKILQGILVMHCDLDFVGREIHSLGAMYFAGFTDDVHARLKAMIYMAYTYINRPSPVPDLAIPIFLDALKIKDNALMAESSIHEYIGLATAYAQNRDEAKALDTLAQGEKALSGLSIDGDRDEFYLWKGKTFIALAPHFQSGNYYSKAYNTFSVPHGQETAKAMCGAAIVQADAMCGLGDLDEFAKCLKRGMQIAFQINSKKRQSEARAVVLHKAPKSWQNEKQYQDLVKMLNN